MTECIGKTCKPRHKPHSQILNEQIQSNDDKILILKYHTCFITYLEIQYKYWDSDIREHICYTTIKSGMCLQTQLTSSAEPVRFDECCCSGHGAGWGNGRRQKEFLK